MQPSLPQQRIRIVKASDAVLACSGLANSPNCGMAPMGRDIAFAKLEALRKGAAMARGSVT
jgi:methionine synthase II (cobalamin-independent)